jgi:hypothetical protein
MVFWLMEKPLASGGFFFLMYLNGSERSQEQSSRKDLNNNGLRERLLYHLDFLTKGIIYWRGCLFLFHLSLLRKFQQKMYIGLMLIGFLFMGIGMVVQSQLRSKFKKYSQTALLNGLSGREIAERMLRDHHISNVKIISVSGQLTDHYNPATRTVNLSHDVYHGRSTASAAVAAHEVGHAIQHATAYAMLGIRSSLVPVVNIANGIMPFALMLGVALLGQFPALLLVAIFAQVAITLFTLITLPVEFDASNRALVWMRQSNIAVGHEYDEAKDALKWAALTYVVAALAAVVQLVYMISKYAGRK